MAEIDKPQKEMAKIEPVDVKAEMEAITGTMKLFDKLQPKGRERAFTYLANALGLAGMVTAAPARQGGSGGLIDPSKVGHSKADNIKYATFAELYDAARPDSGPQKALVGGYWFQVCGGADDFVAADVNKAISNVSGPLSNITVALDALKALKPAQVIQIGKSGKAQQARKKYKLTVAGIRVVEEMIAREG